MGRDADPSIKVALLEKTLEYLLKNGVLDLSLRPLAKALDTNARMLIYHFESKEQLIVAALELAQQRQLEALSNSPKPKANAKAELIYLWAWFSSDEFLAFTKLLFEVEALSMNGQDHYRSFAIQILNGWGSFVQSRFEKCTITTANVIVSAFSGFLLDLLVTKDKKRVTASFKAFADLVSKEKL